jgi:hypothetical protein
MPSFAGSRTETQWSSGSRPRHNLSRQRLSDRLDDRPVRKKSLEKGVLLLPFLLKPS